MCYIQKIAPLDYPGTASILGHIVRMNDIIDGGLEETAQGTTNFLDDDGSKMTSTTTGCHGLKQLT